MRFGKAIKKYGWDNIQHEIIASNLTESEAKNMEIKLISVLDSCGKQGYNVSIGGNDGHGDLLSVPYYQFDLDGVFIKKYDNRRFIAEEFNISRDAVFSANKYKRPLAGYYFCKEENVFFIDGIPTIKNFHEFKKEPQRMRVYVFDNNGNFIEVCKNTTETSKKYDISYGCLISRLHDNVKGTTKKYNYIWKFEKDVEFINGKPYIPNFITRNYEFYFFDRNYNFVKKYNNIHEAAKDTDWDENKIYNSSERLSLCNKRSTIRGFWRRSKDVQESEENSGSFIMLR